MFCFLEEDFVRPLVHIGGVCGVCGPKRGRIHTLSSISLRVGRKRFVTVIKRSNSNGSAFVGVLNYLSAPSSKRCFLSKGSITGLSSGRLSSVHGRGVNFVFRKFGLVPGLSTLKGMRLPLVCHKLKGRREGRVTKRTLSGIKLRGHVSREPGRLSNKRRRHITMTETVTTRPPVVLTSRPANGLSDGSAVRVVGVLGSLRRSKEAIVVVARSSRVTGRMSHIIHVVSKGVIDSDMGRWRFGYLPTLGREKRCFAVSRSLGRYPLSVFLVECFLLRFWLLLFAFCSASADSVLGFDSFPTVS